MSLRQCIVWHFPPHYSVHPFTLTTAPSSDATFPEISGFPEIRKRKEKEKEKKKKKKKNLDFFFIYFFYNMTISTQYSIKHRNNV